MGLPVAVDQHVPGLQIPMHDALLVGMPNGIADIHEQIKGRADIRLRRRNPAVHMDGIHAKSSVTWTITERALCQVVNPVIISTCLLR